MGKLDDRAAIITGGGTGIGRAIALEFAKEEANVVLAGRNLANLEKVAQEIKSSGRHSLAIATDVGVKEQVQNLVEQTKKEFGRIDILVNNAGCGPFYPIATMPEDGWAITMNTNLKGTFLCIQAVTKYMIEQKYGKIINIGSVVGTRTGRPEDTCYGVSKGAVQLLTKYATKEFTPYGININCIAPGAIEAPMNRPGRGEEQVEQWFAGAKKVPAGRLGNRQDIANLALFLATDDSSFICGETIIMDGGMHVML